MLKLLAVLGGLYFAQASPVIGTQYAVHGNSTPTGCKVMPGDASWPAPEVWTSALPGVIPRAAADAQSGEPDYRFQPTSIKDIQAAVNFARTHNVRLSLLNSGHDFLGRNMASSGLWIDITAMTGVNVLPSFTPSLKGTKSVSGNETNVIKPVEGQQAAVTFGSGTSTQELNNALDPSGLFTMGAAHGAVSAGGGYLQTAGHGPLTRNYGLAADNALEYKVVTADGQLRIANEVSHPELYWALRGGGGLTYGIVAEATVKAYPTPVMTVTNWWLNSTADDSHFYDAIAYLHTQLAGLNAQGVQGYYNIYPAAMKGIMITANEDAGMEKAAAVWAPIFKVFESHPGVKPIAMKQYQYTSYKQFFDARFGVLCDDDGMAMPEGIIPMDSHLLDAVALNDTGNAAALQQAVPRVPGGILRGNFVGGGQVMKNAALNNAVNPAWRKAYTHLIAVGSGLVGTAKGDFNVDSLRKLAPDMGAYANEASSTEQNWKQYFWGDHYPRLSSIKTLYDPTGVFWVSPGINADHFTEKGGRICSVAVSPTSTTATAPAFDNHVFATDPDPNEDALSNFPGQPLLPTDMCSMGSRKQKRNVFGEAPSPT